MRTLRLWVGVAVCAAGLAGVTRAQYFPPPYSPSPLPQAPSTCNPGYYAPNYCGCLYGPNYCLRPPFEPFNGARPCLGGPAKSPVFPTHPYARSPRDYFMLDP